MCNTANEQPQRIRFDIYQMPTTEGVRVLLERTGLDWMLASLMGLGEFAAKDADLIRQMFHYRFDKETTNA